MYQLASWLVWLKIYVGYYLLWMPTHLSGRTDFPISTCDREHCGWTWYSFRNLDMLFFLKYSQTLLCLTTWSTFDEGRKKNQYENLRKLLSHGICNFCFYLMELHHYRPSSSLYFLPFTVKCWHKNRLLREGDICLAFWFLYCTVTHYVSVAHTVQNILIKLIVYMHQNPVSLLVIAWNTCFSFGLLSGLNLHRDGLTRICSLMSILNL